MEEINLSVFYALLCFRFAGVETTPSHLTADWGEGVSPFSVLICEESVGKEAKPFTFCWEQRKKKLGYSRE